MYSVYIIIIIKRVMHKLIIIVLVTYVTVKGQTTQRKPWRQGKTTPHNFANGEVKKEEKS